MKAVRLDQLVRLVEERLPVEPVSGQTLRALRDSAQRFCFDTECWKQELDAIDIVADQLIYSLAHGWQAETKRIYTIYQRTAADITAGNLGTERDATGDIFTPSTQKYRFYSAPSASNVTGGLVFTCVLVPNLNTDEMPEWLIGLYGTAFVAGAIEDMCSRRGNGKMYDPATALLYHRKYMNMVNAACAEVFKCQSNASPTVNPLFNLASSSGGGYRTAI